MRGRAATAWLLAGISVHRCCLAVLLGEPQPEDAPPAGASAGGSEAALEEGRRRWAADREVYEALGPLTWQNVSHRLVTAFRSEKPKGKKSQKVQKDAWEGPRWLYAGEHKAGTHLMAELSKLQAKALGVQACRGKSCNDEVKMIGPHRCSFPEDVVVYQCREHSKHAKYWREKGGPNFRGVFIVRDPIAMVVSGYVYDINYNDMAWHPDWSMRAKHITDGIADEVKFMLEGPLPAMLDMYKYATASQDMMVVRMEEFMQSQSSFDSTVSRAYDYMVGDILDEPSLKMLKKAAKLEDPNRQTQFAHPSWVGAPDAKQLTLQALGAIPKELMDQLKYYRNALGYFGDPQDISASGGA